MTVLKWKEIEEIAGSVSLEIKKVLMEFKDVMPEKLPENLPLRRDVNHRIELFSTKPPAKALYRMSQPELSELKKQLKELLDDGLIVPTKSPFGASVLFQRKHDGSLRMCIDYMGFNKITIRNKYPLPLPADWFDQLSRAKVFNKVDLRSGYWQVQFAKGDEYKTTCVTR